MTPTYLSANSYTTPRSFDKEHGSIFGCNWLVVGQVDTIGPGELVTRTIGRWRILLARDPNGVLRAFHNVCRHRAGPLIWDGDGPQESAKIRCRYHGWRYDWNGELLSAPDFGEVLPKPELSLFSLRVVESGSLIWVNFSNSAPPLNQSLPDVVKPLSRLSDFELFCEQSHTLKCNWKVYVENYLEGYHIPYVHPDLVKDLRMSSYQVQVHERHITHHVDMKEGAIHNGFWAYIWPNTAINIYGSGASIERIVPVGPSETRIEYQYLFLSGVSDQEKEETIKSSVLLTAEDKQICESVYQNLVSGVYSSGYLSPRHESGILAFQRWVLESLKPKGADAL